ncbi:MAG: transposase, partial [Nitrososphaeraceae archaeon]
ELTDDQWKLLVPSIPLPAYTGRPRADDRNCINGILYVFMVDGHTYQVRFLQDSLGATQEIEC